MPHRVRFGRGKGESALHGWRHKRVNSFLLRIPVQLTGSTRTSSLRWTAATRGSQRAQAARARREVRRTTLGVCVCARARPSAHPTAHPHITAAPSRRSVWAFLTFCKTLLTQRTQLLPRPLLLSREERDRHAYGPRPHSISARRSAILGHGPSPAANQSSPAQRSWSGAVCAPARCEEFCRAVYAKTHCRLCKCTVCSFCAAHSPPPPAARPPTSSPPAATPEPAAHAVGARHERGHRATPPPPTARPPTSSPPAATPKPAAHAVRRRGRRPPPPPPFETVAERSDGPVHAINDLQRRACKSDLAIGVLTQSRDSPRWRAVPRTNAFGWCAKPP